MKDPLKELGLLSRERDAERERFEADPSNVPPLTDAQRASAIAAVATSRPPEPSRWMPRVFAFSGALAVAAAVLFIFFMPGAARLPTYTLDVPSIGYSTMRSEPEPGRVLKLSNGMELEVLLRPDAPSSRVSSARADLVLDGETQKLDWEVELAETGAVRFRGELGRQVKLPLGRSRLRFSIGDLDAPVPSDRVRIMELDVEVVE